MGDASKIKQVSSKKISRKSGTRRPVKQSSNSGAIIFLGVCILVLAGVFLVVDMQKKIEPEETEKHTENLSKVKEKSKDEKPHKLEQKKKKPEKKKIELEKKKAPTKNEINLNECQDFIQKIREQKTFVCQACNNSGEMDRDTIIGVQKSGCLYCRENRETGKRERRQEFIFVSSIDLYNSSSGSLRAKAGYQYLIYGKPLDVGVHGKKPYVVLEGSKNLGVKFYLFGQSVKRIENLEKGQHLIILTPVGSFNFREKPFSMDNCRIIWPKH